MVLQRFFLPLRRFNPSRRVLKSFSSDHLIRLFSNGSTDSGGNGTSKYAAAHSLSSSSQLLTIATARQLKGDIPEAIELANLALEKQRREGDPHAIADTTLFLGKLYQLETKYQDAETSFKESYSLQINHAPNSRGEYAALSHLATVQRRLGRFDDAEKNYTIALRGLESTVGWSDGFTNHTSFELARLYRERGQSKESIKILNNMKKGLINVFGEDDPRVLQLNGEEAEIYNVLGDQEKAIESLDEVVQKLPPGSPEARKAFMRLEELKEKNEKKKNGVPSVHLTITKGKKSE